MRIASKQILILILLLPAFNFAGTVSYGQDKPPVARLSHENARSRKPGVQGTGAQIKGAPIQATTESEPSKLRPHVTRHALPRPSLVPPPPPGAFLGSPLDFAPGTMGMVSPEYQSPAQLKQSLNDLSDQLTRASKSLDDKQKSSQEKKDRAKQFESLYSEGVISKRELETAQSDASAGDDGISDLQAKVAIIKQSKQAVETALKKLNKNVQPEKKSLSDKVVHPQAESKTPPPQ